MPYPTIEMMEVGDDYRVYIEFSDTHQLMFGTAVGYEANINLGVPENRVLFWGDEPDTFVEILNGSYYAEVTCQFYKATTYYRIPKINWQNWTVFCENVIGGDIPYMTEDEWLARFEEPAPIPRPRGDGPDEDEDEDEAPRGGRKRKTRVRKIKRRKTYRRKQ